jgi:hypothetical protein
MAPNAEAQASKSDVVGEVMSVCVEAEVAMQKVKASAARWLVGELFSARCMHGIHAGRRASLVEGGT